MSIKKTEKPCKNNAIPEIKNTIEGINSRLDEAENLMSDLEDKVEKTSNQNRKKKKIFK